MTCSKILQTLPNETFFLFSHFIWSINLLSLKEFSTDTWTWFFSDTDFSGVHIFLQKNFDAACCMMQKVDLQKQRKKKREKHAKRKNLFFALFFSFTPSHTVLKMDFFCPKKKKNTLPISEPLKSTRKICIFLGFCKIVGILYLEVKKSVRTANV